jgi:hypothetical protein
MASLIALRWAETSSSFCCFHVLRDCVHSGLQGTTRGCLRNARLKLPRPARLAGCWRAPFGRRIATFIRYEQRWRCADRHPIARLIQEARAEGFMALGEDARDPAV